MQHTRKLLTVVCLVLFLFSVPTLAQQGNTRIYLEDQVVDIGQNFTVDILVESYADIVSTSFSLEWDTAVINLTGLANLAFDIDEDEHFGFTRVNEGILTFSWFDGSASFEGVSLNDGDLIFSVNYQATGIGGSETEVFFSDTVTTREVADTSFEAIAADFDGGTISVGPSSTAEFSLLPPAAVRIHPMPFEEKTYVSFIQPVAGDFTISLVSAYGQLLHTQRFTGREAQEHSIALNRSLFPVTGSYFAQIEGAGFRCTKPIVIE